MTGPLLIAVFVLGAEAPSVLETGYVVQIDVAGYVDVPLTDPPPEELPLRSVEVLCRLGEPFRSRTTIGKEATTISGVLKRADDESANAGEFVVELHYSHAVDTAQTVPVAPGREQKLSDVTSLHARIAADLDSPVVCGSILTKAEDQHPERPKRTSKTTVTVTVSEDAASKE